VAVTYQLLTPLWVAQPSGLSKYHPLGHLELLLLKETVIGVPIGAALVHVLPPCAPGLTKTSKETPEHVLPDGGFKQRASAFLCFLESSLSVSPV
jgi:hypothetical protein